MEAQLRQPAAAPDPVAGNGINEQRDRRRINTVGGKLGTLGHSPGNDRGGSGAEHRLKHRIGPQRNAFGQNRAVILADHGVDPAEQRCARAEHYAEAKQPEAGRTDAEVHQILHQDIACIFGPCEARLTHGKARLHEKHQRRSQQHPQGIDARVHIHSPSFRRIQRKPKKRAKGLRTAPSLVLEWAYGSRGTFPCQDGIQRKYII